MPQGKSRDSIKSISTIKNNQPTEGIIEQEQRNERKNDYRRSEAEVEINHAIERIMQHNEVPGTTHRDKFRVSVGSLRKLTKRSSKIIEEIIDQRSDEIEKHHQKHQLLNPRHNAKGNNAPSIETVIPL